MEKCFILKTDQIPFVTSVYGSRLILYFENTTDFMMLYHIYFLTAGLTLNRCVAQIKVGDGLPLTGLPLHSLIIKSPK